MLLSVILPTYNEKDNILPLLGKIRKTLTTHLNDCELIVVDDNSPDGTGKLAQEKYQNDPRVKIFIRENERGLATAIKFGILNSTGENLVVMDTDFNHDPALIPQMIELLKHYDLVIGSRFVTGGGMEDKKRYWLSLLYNYALRIFLWLSTRDNLSGYFAIRRERLMSLPANRIFFGYGDYFMRLNFFALKQNFKIIEVPVFYQLRKGGQSKSSFFRMFLQYSLAAVRLRFSRIF